MGRWMFWGLALAAGVLMSAFVLTSGPFHYVYSLGAILVGMQYFRREEERKPRIWFVVLVLLMALFLPMLYVMLAYVNGWYIDPKYLT